MGIIIRQSIKGTLATYVGVFIGLITTFFIITQYLTAEEVGLTRVLVDASTLFSSLALMGTNSSTLRFYPHFKDDSRNQQGLYFWTLIIPFIGFLIFMGFFFLFKGLIVSIFQENSPLFVNYVYYTLPLAFFILYMGVFETNATILSRVAVPRLIREVFIRLALLAGYLLFGFHIIDLDGLVLCFCASYLGAALLNLFYLLFSQKISFKPKFGNISKELRREFFLYTLFLITYTLVSSVLPTLSSFFISAKMGLVFTGIYAIANYIATMVEIPSRSLVAIVQPRISVAMRSTPPDIATTTKLFQKVTLNQFLASTFILLITWINIDLFFSLLPHGETYEAGKWVVLILALNKIVISSFGIGGNAIGYSKWYYSSLFFTLFLTFLSVMLNNYLIPIYGMEGGALATFFSYAIYYIVLLLYVKLRIGTHSFSTNLLKVLAIIAGMLILNHLCTFVNNHIFNMEKTVWRLAEGVVRTCFVSGLGVAATLWWKVSPEVNQIFGTIKQKVLHKI